MGKIVKCPAQNHKSVGIIIVGKQWMVDAFLFHQILNLDQWFSFGYFYRDIVTFQQPWLFYKKKTLCANILCYRKKEKESG